MTDLVSFVCVRSDHQWSTADRGPLHQVEGGLAYCPDSSLDGHDGHEWRPCRPAPRVRAAAIAAQLGAVESAAS